MITECVGVGCCEMAEFIKNDFALFAKSARHQSHLSALGHVSGHGRTGANRLIVGMGMD
jgi:hypothetical protein